MHRIVWHRYVCIGMSSIRVHRKSLALFEFGLVYVFKDLNQSPSYCASCFWLFISLFYGSFAVVLVTVTTSYDSFP